MTLPIPGPHLAAVAVAVAVYAAVQVLLAVRYRPCAQSHLVSVLAGDPGDGARRRGTGGRGGQELSPTAHVDSARRRGTGR